MRRDQKTGRSVPETLGDLLHYVEQEMDPRLVGNVERKLDCVNAVRAMIENTRGGANVKLREDVNVDQMMGQVIMKSAQFARARLREQLQTYEAPDELVMLAGIIVHTGDKKRMGALVEKLEQALRHPALHPAKHDGLKKVINWVKMNLQGN